MKKFLIIVLLLFGFGFSNVYLAQTGGRKRERRNDKFARGGEGRKGLFGRLKKSRPAWKPRNTPVDRSRYGDNRKLFSRNWTKGKQFNSKVLAKRNADRARKRVRGSKNFHRKKY